MKNKKNFLVGLIVGSKSDLDIVKLAEEVLTLLNIPYEKKILSAHRTPEETIAYAKSAEKRGIEVIIAAAGMAAHLPGVIAANTTIPVIGLPIKGELMGLDSLLSIVQMPTGVPVATVAINGAKNAAYLSAEILALKYPDIKRKLKAEREKIKDAVKK